MVLTCAKPRLVGLVAAVILAVTVPVQGHTLSRVALELREFAGDGLQGHGRGGRVAGGEDAAHPGQQRRPPH